MYRTAFYVSAILIVAGTVFLYAISQTDAAPVYTGGGSVTIDLSSPATAIGGVTPVAGTFTTLVATSGIDSTNIGASTPGTGKFTTLRATSLDYTPIGGTSPSTGAFTTLSASGLLTSTVASGSPPFSVASTTNVANLNASSLNGATFAAPGAIGGGTPSTGAFTTASVTGPITSTQATGTAPFTIASTTKSTNMNADLLDGGDWASPVAIGTTAPAAGTFTYITASGIDATPIGANTAAALTATTGNFSGAITSTVAGGSPPFVLASSTKSTNLNADLLDGTDWTAPGSIGGVTPGAAAFTTVTASGAITSTVTTGSPPFVVASTTNVANLNAATVNGDTMEAPGPIGGGTPGSGAFTTLSATGVITSTQATGTAPFTIASTTVNTNLNADLLDGADWADPSGIGSGTPSTGIFTTLLGNTSVKGPVVGPNTTGQLAQGDATPDTTAQNVWQCYGKDALIITDFDSPSPEFPQILYLFGAFLNEIQTVTLTNASVGETWTLTYGAETTGNLAYDATAQDVEDALIALTSILPAAVDVTGSAGGPYTVIFQNTSGQTDVSDMTGAGTGDLTVGVVETVKGAAACTSVVDDGAEIQLAGDWTMTGGATLTLIYNTGTDKWMELTRSAT